MKYQKPHKNKYKKSNNEEEFQHSRKRLRNYYMNKIKKLKK